MLGALALAGLVTCTADRDLCSQGLRNDVASWLLHAVAACKPATEVTLLFLEAAQLGVCKRRKCYRRLQASSEVPCMNQ